MKDRRILILRYLGCAGLLLCVYPPTALLDALLGHTPFYGLMHALLLAACGLLTFLLTEFLRRAVRIPVLRFLLLAGWILLLSALAGWAVLRTSWYEIALCALLAAAICIAGARMTSRTYEDYATRYQLIGIPVEYAVGLFLYWCLQQFIPHPNLPLIWVALLFVSLALLLLVRNQANIDTLTASRHYSLETLPEKIRKRNLILLVVIFLGVLLLFGGIVWAAPWVSLAAAALGDWLKAALRFLFSLWGGGDEGEEALAESLPQQDMGFGEVETENEWIGQLIQVLMVLLIAAALIAVLYSNRSAIRQALSRFFRFLLNWLRSLFSRLPLFPDRDGDAEYVDTTENAVTTIPSDTRHSQLSRRIWFRTYRRYRKMPPSDRKFREGFSLAVQGCALCGIPRLPSDTTLDIASKSSEVTGEEYLSVTREYNVLFYGETSVPLTSQSGLDQALERLSSVMRSRPHRPSADSR